TRGARFAGDGARLYGPPLRVALMVWPLAAVVIAFGAMAVAIPLGGTPWPALALVGVAGVVGCGTLAAWMLVDLARIHVARTDDRRARVALLAAFRVIGRQAPRLLLIFLAFGIALPLAASGMLAVRTWLSGLTWPSILAGVFVQQAYVFVRTWLRASLVASEVVLVEADAASRAARAAAEPAASVAAIEERPEVLVI